MKITIKRYFERTRQIADFVPVKTACEASIELDIDPNTSDPDRMEQLQTNSQLLADFCIAEVEQTLRSYYPICIRCGARGQTVNLNKEGMCGQCVSTLTIEARQFKTDNAKNRATKAERGETTVEY